MDHCWGFRVVGVNNEDLGGEEEELSWQPANVSFGHAEYRQHNSSPHVPYNTPDCYHPTC